MKILVLLPRFPYPLDKGDKLRAYHQIVELAQRHEVYLFALSHQKVSNEQKKALQPYCKEIHIEHLSPIACYAHVLLSFFKGQPLQLGYWTTHHAQRAFNEYRCNIQPDIIYRQMVRTIQYSGGGVLDFQDALSLNTYRRMERSHGFLKMVLKYETRTLQLAEQKALQTFDATTIISQTDRDAISPTVNIVPNGVDTEYFNTKHITPKTRHTICFCGNMAYAPNVDASRYLIEDVMPLVWAQKPNTTVLLAGADPKPAVRALASKNVIVSARLTDIREAYASSQIFVAPMRIGSGLQNKLLEAMSMRLPCVTTPIAATPLGPQPPVLIGNNPAALSEHILQLINSEELCSRLADTGHQFVQNHYSWQAAIIPLEKIIKP